MASRTVIYSYFWTKYILGGASLDGVRYVSYYMVFFYAGEVPGGVGEGRRRFRVGEEKRREKR